MTPDRRAFAMLAVFGGSVLLAGCPALLSDFSVGEADSGSDGASGGSSGGSSSGSSSGSASSSSGGVDANCGDSQAAPHNCGRCGHDCQGGACDAGACESVTLATGQRSPWGIAVDGTNVYWGNQGAGDGGTLMECAVNGCNNSPTPLVSYSAAVGHGGVYVVAVDSTNVYAAAGDVIACGIKGCSNNPTIIASAQNAAYGIAADSSNVYWSDGNGNVVKFPVGGGSPTTLATSQGVPVPIAVGSTSVYWVNSTGAVVRCGVAGCSGSPVTLASVGSAYDVALDATSVYLTYNAMGDGVAKVPLGGGNATTLASGQNSPRGLAVDGTSVYWAANGSVMKCAVNGCSNKPTPIASASSCVGIAVDSTSVYWTNSGDGTVRKVAK